MTKAHTEEQFATFISQLKETNQTLDFFCDFNKISENVNNITVDGFEFVWITDGIGWKSARNKLQEAYNIIPSVYNLTDIEKFIEIIK